MNALPEAVQAYFDANNEQDVDGALDCFSDAASVFDIGESMEMHGKDQIGDWLTGTISRYKLTTEITQALERPKDFIVAALVSGDFPGSPLEFFYEFQLKDGKIEQLVINLSR